MSLSLDDQAQISHVARLAVLAMCARGVASEDFQASPEVVEVRFTVRRAYGVCEEMPVDVEYISLQGFPVGGMSL